MGNTTSRPHSPEQKERLQKVVSYRKENNNNNNNFTGLKVIYRV